MLLCGKYGLHKQQSDRGNDTFASCWLKKKLQILTELTLIDTHTNKKKCIAATLPFDAVNLNRLLKQYMHAFTETWMHTRTEALEHNNNNTLLKCMIIRGFDVVNFI